MKLEANQLELFLDSFHQGVALVDETMAIVAANSQFRRLLPLTRSGVVLSEMYPMLANSLVDYIVAAQDGTQSRIERFPWEVEGILLHWMLHFNPVPVDLSSKKLAMIIVEDISEMVTMVAQFEENYTELQHQLSAARRYQDALFTENYVSDDVSCKAYAKPCFELSGDFFSASKVGDNSLFIIGDVQSHGIDVAMRAITLQHLTSMWLTEKSSPAKVMSDLNSFIINDQDDGLWFCCLLVVYYNRQIGAITYCRAGIPEPVLMRRNGDVVKLETGNTPLGAFPKEEYEEASMTVYPEDRLLMFSDGITESRNVGNLAEMYGHENLIADYGRVALGNSDHHLLKIMDSVIRYMGTNDFEDDVTLAEIIFS